MERIRNAAENGGYALHRTLDGQITKLLTETQDRRAQVQEALDLLGESEQGSRELEEKRAALEEVVEQLVEARIVCKPLLSGSTDASAITTRVHDILKKACGVLHINYEDLAFPSLPEKLSTPPTPPSFPDTDKSPHSPSKNS